MAASFRSVAIGPVSLSVRLRPSFFFFGGSSRPAYAPIGPPDVTQRSGVIRWRGACSALANHLPAASASCRARSSRRCVALSPTHIRMSAPSSCVSSIARLRACCHGRRDLYCGRVRDLSGPGALRPLGRVRRVRLGRLCKRQWQCRDGRCERNWRERRPDHRQIPARGRQAVSLPGLMLAVDRVMAGLNSVSFNVKSRGPGQAGYPGAISRL